MAEVADSPEFSVSIINNIKSAIGEDFYSCFKLKPANIKAQLISSFDTCFNATVRLL